MLWDLFQLGLDIAGIFDPTPACDVANGFISLFRGDISGAVISGIGCIPYAGDLAKVGRVSKQADTAFAALRLAGRNPRFARLARPLFEKLLKALDKIPLDKIPIPKKLRAKLKRLRNELATFLDPWRRTPRNLKEKLALDEAKAGAGKKIIDNLGDPRFRGMEKWQHVHRNADGSVIVIHYVRDPKTGELLDFKFIDR